MPKLNGEGSITSKVGYALKNIRFFGKRQECVSKLKHLWSKEKWPKDNQTVFGLGPDAVHRTTNDVRNGLGYMGLLRILLRLFRPKRTSHRYRRPDNSYSPISEPTRLVKRDHSEVLRHIDETLGQQILRGHCWVIDGDTIVINKVHIRLAGIDAPEIDHPYGQNAKRALMRLCRGQVVTAVMNGSTSHERAVATCTLEDGRDLSAEMVRAGFALDWEKYSGGQYRHLEVDGIRKKLWRVEARHRGKLPPS